MLILLGSASLLFGASMQFEMLDTNKDGLVTNEEFNSVKEKRMLEKKSDGKMLQNYNDSPSFKDLDTNYDGKLSEKEFTHMQNVRFQNRSEERQTYKHNLKRAQITEGSKMSETLDKDKKIESKGLYK